ncbi:hypothetical protein B0A48_09930 [Cryoendolithus antarcticus]|uniref:Anaphase-promoting complex subunit 4 n=1 Tax=Cryoendolithus antarcticus TaxID=1507870 RepID=A0A1V8T344_9PEZI|nr:hypothetical protein B0A48_09930 [Cryoendolithus antarcticus]
MQPSPPTLPLFSSSVLPNPSLSDLATYNTPHNLLALPTSTTEVSVFRLSGQIAFIIRPKPRSEDAAITALQWKPDGSAIAVGWSDGGYGIYDGGTGRVVSEGRVGGEGHGEWRLDLHPSVEGDKEEEGAEERAVRSFGWEVHVSDDRSMKGKPLGGLLEEGEVDTEAWAEGWEHQGSGKGGNERLKSRLGDLPRAIAVMDVTKVLPRLSALPAHGMRGGMDGSRFGTKAATDAAFETRGEDDAGTVNVLFVYTDVGEVQVLLDETVPIGKFTLASKPLLHASHPQSSTHAFLSRDQSDKVQLHSQPLPLDTLGGSLLYTTSRDTTRVSNLLSYVLQTLRCTAHDFTTSLVLPTRLIQNVSLTLSESSPPQGDLKHNLTHLAVTGTFKPALLEWLSDIVKEPGHKRWDAAITTLYSNVQNHMFVHLLPALDRLSIAVTSLHGHAKYHDGAAIFDIPAQLFTNILEGIDALRTVAYKVLTICTREWALWRTFSKWLRVMIDISIAGPGSKTALEMEEKEAGGLDVGAVMEYVGEVLLRSQLADCLGALPGFGGAVDSKEAFFTHPVVQQQSYDATLKAIERAAKEDAPKSVPDGDKAVMNLQVIAVSLAGNVRVAMERLAVWQGRLLEKPSLPLQVDGAVGARMHHIRMLNPVGAESQLALLSTEDGKLRLTARLSANHGGESASIATIGEAVDAKFMDDRTAICLCRHQGGFCLLVINSPPSALPSTEPASDHRMLHHFPADDAFQPASLVVGGRDRKEVVVVFSDDGRSWRTYDLAAGLRGVGDGAEGEEWDDDDGEDEMDMR